MENKSTTIKVTKQTQEDLNKLKIENESYSTIIRKLLDEQEENKLKLRTYENILEKQWIIPNPFTLDGVENLLNRNINNEIPIIIKKLAPSMIDFKIMANKEIPKYTYDEFELFIAKSQQLIDNIKSMMESNGLNKENGNIKQMDIQNSLKNYIEGLYVIIHNIELQKETDIQTMDIDVIDIYASTSLYEFIENSSGINIKTEYKKDMVNLYPQQRMEITCEYQTEFYNVVLNGNPIMFYDKEIPFQVGDSHGYMGNLFIFHKEFDLYPLFHALFVHQKIIDENHDGDIVIDTLNTKFRIGGYLVNWKFNQDTCKIYDVNIIEDLENKS